jgi:hypothetical protein
MTPIISLLIFLKGSFNDTNSNNSFETLMTHITLSVKVDNQRVGLTRSNL